MVLKSPLPSCVTVTLREVTGVMECKGCYIQVWREDPEEGGGDENTMQRSGGIMCTLKYVLMQ